MREHQGKVVDGGQLRRIEALEVAQAGAEPLHARADPLVTPAPASDHNEVGPVSHHRPGLEQCLEVLARLDGADEQDESFGQLQPRARILEVLGAQRPKQIRYALVDHRDPRRGHPEQRLQVGRGVLRHGDHAVCVAQRPRNDPTGAERLAGWKPLALAIDRQVVDRDHGRAADLTQRQHAGRTEEGVGPERPDPTGPLEMAADEARGRERTVRDSGRAVGRIRALGNEHRHTAVGPRHGHRVQHLSRVNADARARSREPVTVDRKV